MRNTNSTYREISLIVELQRAIKYLRLGLSELQNITPANDFYDPVFLHLSNGIERMLKVMLCLSFKEQNNRLPNTNEIWKLKEGHDLMLLKKKVEKITIPPSARWCEGDYETIVSDDSIDLVCLILAKFAQKSRYFNLDAILGYDQDFDSQREWERLETFLAKKAFGESEYYKLLAHPKSLNAIYKTINKELIVLIERFVRALCRQFVFGNFSKESNKFLIVISDFYLIEDEQLGHTVYSEFPIYEQISRKKQR
ncbi:MAG: hypothetical protein HWE21_03420 [Cytophagia bacterium]|nr:hypothetical protein [Cytophagia bacterium]